MHLVTEVMESQPGRMRFSDSSIDGRKIQNEEPHRSSAMEVGKKKNKINASHQHHTSASAQSPPALQTST